MLERIKYNYLFFLLLLSSVTMFYQSCSTPTKLSAYDSGGNSSYKNGTKISNEDKLEIESERKILYNASLELFVKVPDTVNSKISSISKKYEGYIQYSSANKTVIRVKSEHLEKAINEISELGELDNKSITGQDVTEEYADFEIRLSNALKARHRYLELLAKAENVEAALKVEKELERLNNTIEYIKGKLERLDHLSEYSTITSYLKIKKKPGILGYIGIGIYKSIKWLFVRN